MKVSERSAEAYIGAAAIGGVIAACIIGYWLVLGVNIEQPPHAQHLLLGTYHIDHLRYWDALLGLYGFLGAFAMTAEPEEDPVELGEGLVLLVFGAALAALIVRAPALRGVDLASWRSLATVWGLVASASFVLLAAGKGRACILVLLGASFSISLRGGVVLGAFMTLGAAIVFGSVLLVHLRAMRYWVRRSAF